MFSMYPNKHFNFPWSRSGAIIGLAALDRLDFPAAIAAQDLMCDKKNSSADEVHDGGKR